MLVIESATYYRHDGYPCMDAVINGHEVDINLEQKMLLVEAGAIFIDEKLGCYFDLESQRVEGASDDPATFLLWRRFRDTCNNLAFKPGPVDVSLLSLASEVVKDYSPFSLEDYRRLMVLRDRASGLEREHIGSLVEAFIVGADPDVLEGISAVEREFRD